MEKEKKQIFTLLKGIIVKTETDIHNDPSFKNDMDEEAYQGHFEIIQKIKDCKNIEELFDTMNEEFGMDTWYGIETYLM